jgi:hypothetical protein
MQESQLNILHKKLYLQASFLWVLGRSPPIELTATIFTEILVNVALNTITLILNKQYIIFVPQKKKFFGVV